MSKKILKFPKGFYWGTATSAYQVEGGIRNDWSETGEKYNAGQACDHYNRFEEDFNLAKSMNNNAHRFSIEWARIEPEEGKFDQKEIEHYRKVISALKERNLELFVTLYHWTLPIWFAQKGGWLNKEAPKYFGRFVEKIVGEYKDLVKFWITLNEPNIYTSMSYLKGDWPPFKKSWRIMQRVLNQLVEAHQEAYQIIHKIYPNLQAGIATNNIWYRGIVKLFADYRWNHWFLKNIKNYQDFIGVNFYFTHSLFGFLKLFGLLETSRENKTDMNYLICPEGIYHVLKDLKKYNKPIYITENGLADAKDEKRPKFIIDHLKWVHKAIEEGVDPVRLSKVPHDTKKNSRKSNGVDVRGYFHWSLIDNFEWDKGFRPRFGLVEIDYKTLKRIPRPSSKVYSEICKNNAIII